MQTSQMNVVADANNFLVVYPEGTPNKLGEAHRTWNAIGCCGNAVEDKIDDIGAIRALISDLSKNFKIDPKRIFATGHSNGAMMAEVLGCALSDKIAAVGSNAGGLYYPDCKPTRPVPVILFHGTGDTAYPYLGGKITFDTAKNKPDYPSAKQNALDWATRNSCNLTSAVSLQKGGATCETYSGCKSDASVVLCSLEGNGHTWPGGQEVGGDSSSWLVKLTQKIVGTVNKDISASEEMWKFFSMHPMP